MSRQPARPVTSPTRARVLAGAAVSAMLLTGCASSGGDRAASTTRAATATSTTTSPGDAAAGKRDRDERDLRQMIKDVYATYAQIASTTQDPADPRLVELLTGPQLRAYQGSLTEDNAAGRIWRLPSSTTITTTVEKLTIDGDTADLVVCSANDIQVVDRNTGTLINGEKLARREEWFAQRTPDGWRFHDAKTLKEYRGTLECGA